MNKNNNDYKAEADRILEELKPNHGKGIFARIPEKLHDGILEVKGETGKSIYEIVELSLRLFLSEYHSRKKGDKKV